MKQNKSHHQPPVNKDIKCQWTGGSNTVNTSHQHPLCNTSRQKQLAVRPPPAVLDDKMIVHHWLLLLKWITVLETTKKETNRLDEWRDKRKSVMWVLSLFWHGSSCRKNIISTMRPYFVQVFSRSRLSFFDYLDYQQGSPNDVGFMKSQQRVMGRVTNNSRSF